MITSAQIRAARAMLRWSAEKLAEKSKLGVATIRRADAADNVPQITEANLTAIRNALEAAGVIFVAENGEGPGVRLRKGVAAFEREPTSPEKLRANADHARAKAAKAADRLLGEVNATEDEKAGRRSALTDESALVTKARSKSGSGR